MNKKTDSPQPNSGTSIRQPDLPSSIPTIIDSFKGDFGFLSNFYPSSIWVDGFRYPTVEHAYQAAKSDTPETQRLIRESKSASIAKRLGQAVVLPVDWEVKKIVVMRKLLKEKFRNPLLRALLLATEDALLVEGNNWNDKFWGVCRGTGQNHLGKLLMEIREMYRLAPDED